MVGDHGSDCLVIPAGHSKLHRDQGTKVDAGELRRRGHTPNPIFTVLIWGEDGTKFGEPEVRFREKRGAAGVIRLYRGAAEISVKPKQAFPGFGWRNSF